MSRVMKTACDQCRFRKLKCDSEQPCARCSKLALACTFEHRTTRSKRIELLRSRQSSHGDQLSPVVEDTSLRFSDLTSPRSQDDAQVHLLTHDIDRHSIGVNSVVAEPVTGTVSQRDFVPVSPYPVPTTNHGEIFRSRSFSDGESRRPDQRGATVADGDSWYAEFSQNDVLPWINVFFDRLYLTLPILNRTALYRELMVGKHKANSEFVSMILSLCALSMIQPVLREEYESMPARTELATRMLQAAVKIRSFDFGEHISMDGVITSFFMFATLFGMGLHRAAWLRLREAVECGKTLGLHQPQTYDRLEPETKGQRFRLLLILSVTERGYALQRNHDISITGKHIQDMKNMYMNIGGQGSSLSQGIYIHDDKDIVSMHGLLQLMRLFDAVDEDVIPCWNRSCAPALETCQHLTIGHAEKIYNSVAEALADNAASPWPGQPQALSSIQWADCFVLQQWLLMRSWVSCLTHDLLDNRSALTFMRPTYVLDVAERVANECHAMGYDALEVHGSGMIERIHDIGMGVIMAVQGYDEVLSSARTSSILETYVNLLRQFRDQGRPFSTALETAYRSYVQQPHD